MGFKSPSETAVVVSKIGGSKCEMSYLNLIILSFLAGAYIAFGGLLAIVTKTGMAAPVGLSKLYLGQCFL